MHLVNVKQSQSNVGRHRLEVLKEFGMRTGSILFCVKIGFKRPVLQRDVKKHIIRNKKKKNSGVKRRACQFNSF